VSAAKTPHFLLTSPCAHLRYRIPRIVVML
jgi:hypothetical protein